METESHVCPELGRQEVGDPEGPRAEGGDRIQVELAEERILRG